MKLSEQPALKAEITALPAKEKDKLLLRLIARDKVLTERMHFLLMEQVSGLEDRTEALKSTFLTRAKAFRLKDYDARDLLIQLRYGIRDINHFYKVTKAGFEEAELRLLLLNLFLEDTERKDFIFMRKDGLLLVNFVIKSTLTTLKKIEKLHADLQYDLQEGMNRLLYKIYHTKMATEAKAAGLPQEI